MRLILSMLVLLSGTSAAASADWPPADDYVNAAVNCSNAADPEWCDINRKDFSGQYASATSGDYQGQRNVSFCLSTGCDEAIAKNPILGCAWRIVIIDSGHLSLDSTDTMNLRTYCGNEFVNAAGLRAAKAQAKTLLKMLNP